jgi:hypothetical protein
MKTAAKLLAAMMVASFSTHAFASCACSCVNGQIEAVCSMPSDLPPVCAPRACTAKPLHTALIADKSSIASSTTARKCHETQVLNPQTGAYVAKQVCQ